MRDELNFWDFFRMLAGLAALVLMGLFLSVPLTVLRFLLEAQTR